MRGEISWLQVRGKAKKKKSLDFFFFSFFSTLSSLYSLCGIHQISVAQDSAICSLSIIYRNPSQSLGVMETFQVNTFRTSIAQGRLLYTLWCFKCFSIRQGGGQDTKLFSHQDVLKKSLLKVRSLVFKCSELFLTKDSLSCFISWVKCSHMQGK